MLRAALTYFSWVISETELFLFKIGVAEKGDVFLQFLIWRIGDLFISLHHKTGFRNRGRFCAENMPCDIIARHIFAFYGIRAEPERVLDKTIEG